MTKPSEGVRIGLLGEVVLYGQRGHVSAGTPKQACVLAVLAMQPHRAVTADALMDRLWGDNPPDTARKTLAGYVARLRGLLKDCDLSITCRASSYTLWARPEHIDLHLMRELTGRARQEEPHAAAASRRAAASLWRGTPLTGVRGRWAELARTSLEREHVGIWSELFAAELAAGNHQRILPELAEWVAREPVHETLTAHHMLALHRSGRTTEALAAYRSIRAALRDEHGSEPGRALTELHRRILQDDPQLRPEAATEPVAASRSARTPRQLPAAPHAFTGRHAELTRLDDLIAPDGTLPVIAIVGAGGTGKTALALAWAHRVIDRFPDGQLFIDLQGRSITEPVRAEDALEMLLRSLGVAIADIPERPADKAALYRSLLAGRRVLIVCDNVADSAQLRPLLPGGDSSLVVATSRTRLTGIAAGHDLRSLTLDALSHADAVALLDRLLTEPDTRPYHSRLALLCGGLPLALRLAAGRLDPDLTAEELTDLLTGPERLAALTADDDPALGLRASFDRSMQALPEAAARLFRAMGGFPVSPAEPEPLAAVTGTTVADTLTRLRTLASAHLVHRVDKTQWGMHDLLREYAAARHRELDGPGDRTPAYNWYVDAALAARELVFGVPPHIRLSPPSEVPTPELADRQAALDWVDQRLDTLLAIARHAVADQAWCQVADLVSGLWRHLFFRQRVERMRGLLTDGVLAATRLGDDGRLVEFLRLAAHAESDAGERTAAAERLTESVAIAERIGHGLGAALGRLAMGQVQLQLGDNDSAYRNAQEAHHAAVALEVWHIAADALDDMGHAAAVRGDHLLAKEHITAALRLLAEHGEQGNRDPITTHLGRVQVRLGELDAAEESLQSSLRVAVSTDDRIAEAFNRSIIGCLRTAQGRHQEAVEEHHRALLLGLNSGGTGLHTELLNNAGEGYTAAGRPQRARDHHAEALHIAEQADDPYETMRACRGLADACTALGESDAAAEHRARADRLALRLGIVPRSHEPPAREPQSVG
ncbi:DNA-binding SARP family transcriptional activator [Stackebrandtia albiflava]|uniref:DNA-binding SARP family transcriptional activator n=1 Tax=Stackebrandtia albiflava TaxID=406432 RepID=A0A562VCY4_9ACTN|nr:BTAD domain-containing putative transcriptional regulator [Stackebrandtia albiflava]TWJ15687.1 DNA-binding SARP family transcriptional activator [Stackebrandtia albiflava]